MVPFVAIESSKTPVTSQISKPANELVNKLLLNWLARSSTINNRELWRSIQAFERPLIGDVHHVREGHSSCLSGLSMWVYHQHNRDTLRFNRRWLINVVLTVLFSLPVRSFFIGWSRSSRKWQIVFRPLFWCPRGTPRMCPARPCQHWSMKDLYFWVISSTYSSIFAKTKARFFTFKNLQATNELKVTKYLGFYHIGGWFSPTFASHKFHVPLAEKMMLGEITPLLWPNHSGCWLPPIILVLKSFFSLWFNPPL